VFFNNEITKLVSYVYSIPCFNAFREDVFSHIKHSWTASRNSMLSENIAAELKINEPELIKQVRSKEKDSHIKKKTCSN